MLDDGLAQRIGELDLMVGANPLMGMEEHVAMGDIGLGQCDLGRIQETLGRRILGVEQGAADARFEYVWQPVDDHVGRECLADLRQELLAVVAPTEVRHEHQDLMIAERDGYEIWVQRIQPLHHLAVDLPSADAAMLDAGRDGPMVGSHQERRALLDGRRFERPVDVAGEVGEGSGAVALRFRIGPDIERKARPESTQPTAPNGVGGVDRRRGPWRRRRSDDRAVGHGGVLEVWGSKALFKGSVCFIGRRRPDVKDQTGWWRAASV